MCIPHSHICGRAASGRNLSEGETKIGKQAAWLVKGVSDRKIWRRSAKMDVYSEGVPPAERESKDGLRR